jgi:hypothetical protein
MYALNARTAFSPVGALPPSVDPVWVPQQQIRRCPSGTGPWVDGDDAIDELPGDDLACFGGDEVTIMTSHDDPVSREHVRWAYRTFLDREPESEEAIAAHLAVTDLGALARRFVESAEFRQKYALPATQPRLVPLDAEGNVVDVNVDAATLAALIEHVRRSWEFLGRVRPHHSVLTHPQFKPDVIQENETAFWASGEREAEGFVRILKRSGITSTAELTCLDFGCGIGRVTAPLVKRFAVVHAYDISEPHIEIAKTRTDRAVFHLVRHLPVALAPADVFHSVRR